MNTFFPQETLKRWHYWSIHSRHCFPPVVLHNSQSGSCCSQCPCAGSASLERHPCLSLRTGRSGVTESLTNPTCGWGSPKDQSCTKGSGAVVVSYTSHTEFPHLYRTLVSYCVCYRVREAPYRVQWNHGLGRAGLHSHPPPAPRSFRFTRWACSDFPGKTKAVHCSQQGQTNKH